MRVTAWRDLRIDADGQVVESLERMRAAAASPLAGFERWNINELMGRTVTPGEPCSFDEMMPLWVGRGAMRPITEERMQEYDNFLTSVLGKSRYAEIVDSLAADRGELIEADLGPPHDFLLVEYFLRSLPSVNAKLRILEVGGGYGRLAEVFIRELRQRFTYILCDGVSESIHYSHAYLRARLPDANIYAAFDGNPLPSLADVDVLILPSWRLPELGDHSIDVAMNVASIQEMPQATIDAYFAQFTRLLRLDGLFFFQNSRDFVCRREFVFEKTWQYLMKRQTPRARTINYPTDILQVRDRDMRNENVAIELAYFKDLSERAILQIEREKDTLFKERKESREGRLSMLQREAHLKQKLAEKQALIAKLSDQLAQGRWWSRP